MDCLKCGYLGAEGAECPRCGVIFAKLRPNGLDSEPPPPPPPPDLGDPGPEPVALPPPPPPPAAVPTFQLNPPVARIDVGALLGEIFRVYFANFAAFFLLTLLVCLPSFLMVVLQPANSEAPTFWPWVLGTVAVAMVCQAMAAAALSNGVLLHLRGRPGSMADCLRGTTSALLPVIAVSVVQTLVVGLGLMLCIVPGILAAIAYAVVVPATVEERPGVLGAFQRSADLTRGDRWQVFVVFLALGLLAGAFELASGVLVLLVFGTQAAEMTNSAVSATWLSDFLSLVPTGLSATAAAVLYYRLRSAKESIDVADLVSVFD